MPEPKDRGTSRMLVGAVVSAVAAYVYIVIGTNVFDEVMFAPIALAWTILFLGATIFYLPLEQLMVREVSRGLTPRAVLREHRRSIAVAVGLPVLAFGLYTGVNLETRFAGHDAFVVIIPAMLLLSAAYFMGRGAMAGKRQFVAYGNAVMVEALVRVALGLVAVALWKTVPLYATALVLTPLIIWLWRPFRQTDQAEETLPSGSGFFGSLVVAQGASQAVLASGPLLVAALGARSMAGDELDAMVSIFFVTFTLFRGPVTAAYNLTARALPALTVAHEEGRSQVLATWMKRATLAGVVGAPLLGGIAYALGPWVVRSFYGATYDPQALIAAYAAAGIGLGVSILVISQILIAQERTPELARSWLLAVLVGAMYVLVRQGAADLVVAEAFAVSHAVALAGVWWAARRMQVATS